MFENKSEYTGKWDIEFEFAELLKEELMKKKYMNISDIKTSVSDSNYSNCIMINGKIKKFKFREHMIAAYKVGGYKNYSVDIVVLLKINIPGEKTIRQKSIGTYISDKNYGITLFGGPGGTDDFEKNPYKELQKIRFASRKYWKTIYGKATKNNLRKMINWLTKLK